MKYKIAVLGIGEFLAIALTFHAQTTTGAIAGAVTDESGAVVPGASVVILQEETGISRTVASDAEGRYTAPALSLGNYRVTASREGFQTEVQLRFETFNLFNRPNFGIPSRAVFDRQGRSIAAAGRITSTSTSSRQIQVGLKLLF